MRKSKCFKTVKKLQKIFAALIIFTFTLSLIPAPALASGLTKAEDIAGSQESNIYYGSYWQNAVSGYTPTGTSSSPETFNTNHYTKTAVKYRVLDNNSGMGQILVLSNQGLYADQFNSITSKGDTWATSEIRGTLNNTTATTFDASGNASSWGGFAGDAFSAKELAAIADTTHTGGGRYANSSCQSTDKIFLLSAGEAQAYGFAAGDDRTITRQMTATEMARHAAMYENSGAANVYTIGTSNWWLRSPGNSSSVSSFAYEIPRHGYVSSTGHVTYASSAARAAFNLNSDSILFASAATGGKSDVAKGDGFTLADYKGSNYKLTLYDETIATPSDLAVSQEHTGHATVAELAKDTAAGGTLDLTNGLKSTYGANVGVTFNSSAITDKTANYVSAVVKDKDGNLVNYAKVSNAATGKKVSVGTGSLANGSYEMYLFAEQANGEYETDYASALSKSYTIHKGDVTTNEGTLTADYKNSGYTANLGNGFNLSFEGARYDTAVTTAPTGASLFGAGSTIASLAVGGNTNVSGSMNVATLTRSDGTLTVNGTLTSDKMNATGSNNKLSATGTIAIGTGNIVSGANSIAVGTGHNISGSNSGAFGDPNVVVGSGSYAIGNDNYIGGDNTFVMGNNINTSTYTNSVVLGNGSTVTESNVVSVGSTGNERKITNVAAGKNDTDAVNMSQLKATNATVANLETGLNDTNSRVTNIQNQVVSNTQETREVGAMSAALAGLHYVEPTGEGDDKFTGAVSYGGYRGENAAAVGVAYKPNPNLMVSASTSVGNSQNMYNAGVGFKFGKGDTSATRTSLQKQVKYLNDRNKQQDEKIEQMGAENAQLRAELNELKDLVKKLIKQ